MRTGSDLLSRIYFGDLVTEIHYFSPLNDILAHNSENLLNVRLGTKCKLKQTEKKKKSKLKQTAKFPFTCLLWICSLAKYKRSEQTSL